MITEDDLVKLFKQKKDSHLSELVLNILTRVLLFIFALCASYILVNYYGFKDKLQFWYKSDFKSNNQDIEISEPELDQSTSDKTTNSAATLSIIQPDMADNSIKIPAISIDAPLTWRVNNVPKDVSLGLSKGVIHINGTALPGEKGNVYITGHSSNYVWVRQKYNSIFSNISKLVVGDQIYVKFGNKTYVYKVFDQKIVPANDLSILNSSKGSTLTLATCWPLGTSLKRMVVLANQVYPNPSKNKPSKETIQFTKLPGAR